MKRFLKFLHELGTIGVMGAAGVQLGLSVYAADLPPGEHALLRGAITTVTRGLLIPSLVLTVVTGLATMGLHKSFHNAAWVWVKLAMVPLVFEGTILVIDSPTRAAARLTAQIAAGDLTAMQPLAEALRMERSGLVIMLVVYAANVALSVWRPRIVPKPAPRSA